MNLIRHLCGILYVDRKYYEKPYPDILLPLSDSANIIQYSVYCLASIGCRTIWIISNGEYSQSVKDCLGDYIPDPIAYKLNVDIKDKLIPIYYMNTYVRGENEHSSTEYFLNTRRVLAKTTRAVTDFLVPEKWFFSFVNNLYPLQELGKLKPIVLQDDKNFLDFRDKNGKNVGYIIPNKDATMLHRIYENSRETDLNKLTDNFPKEKYYLFDTHTINSIKNYALILQDEKITSFVYPKVFSELKKRSSYGLDQPFIAKDTKITIRSKP